MNRTMRFLTAAIVLGLTLSAPAQACMFDTDCAVGSRCVKNSGSIYGICMGGMQPGNDNDQVPVRDLFGGSTGQTCSFNTDCGPGHRCANSGLYGVCVRR